jgi:hypothetical protein
MRFLGSSGQPRGGVTDPRVAVPSGLMLTVFGVFLGIAAPDGLGGGGVLLALAVLGGGLTYLGLGVARWRFLRRSGERPGGDPPL